MSSGCIISLWCPLVVYIEHIHIWTMTNIANMAWWASDYIVTIQRPFLWNRLQWPVLCFAALFHSGLQQWDPTSGLLVADSADSAASYSVPTTTMQTSAAAAALCLLRARIWIFLKIVNTWTMFQWKYIDTVSKEDFIHSLAEPSKMSTTSREKKYKRRKINEKRGLGFLPRFSDFCCFVYFVQFQLGLWLWPRGVATQPTAPEAKAGFNRGPVLPSTSTVTQF